MGTANLWDQGGLEPSIEDLLSDPTVLALTRADRLSVEDMRAAIARGRRTLDARSALRGPDVAGLGFDMSADDESLIRLGVRWDQIPRLRGVRSSGAEELWAMLARVGLDTPDAPLGPPLRVELYLTCIACTTRARCRQWLASGRTGGGYRAFCPNGRSIDHMLGIQRWRQAPRPARSIG